MPVKVVTCPRCKHTFESIARRKVSCSKCGKTMNGRYIDTMPLLVEEENEEKTNPWKTMGGIF
jgi:protein-arginine kinase activator protein McsA